MFGASQDISRPDEQILFCSWRWSVTTAAPPVRSLLRSTQMDYLALQITAGEKIERQSLPSELDWNLTTLSLSFI